jgi:hypothetical protein
VVVAPAAVVVVRSVPVAVPALVVVVLEVAAVPEASAGLVVSVVVPQAAAARPRIKITKSASRELIIATSRRP